MRTSAGIGLHYEESLGRTLTRAIAVQSAVRAAVGGAVMLLVIALSAFVAVAVDVDQKSDCALSRDRDGYGRAAALFAFEHPEQQSRFLYRVAKAPDGFRATVVAREGPWLGETWERDASGTARHVSDVCSDGRFGS